MSGGMNMQEAEKVAEKMTYKEAVMNCLGARCVPYRKATKIKMKRLLESIDNDFTDDLLNIGYTKGYQQGIADKRENEQEAYRRGCVDGHAMCSFNNELKIRADERERIVRELEEVKATAIDLVKLPNFIKKDIKELTDMCFEKAIEIVRGGENE